MPNNSFFDQSFDALTPQQQQKRIKEIQNAEQVRLEIQNQKKFKSEILMRLAQTTARPDGAYSSFCLEVFGYIKTQIEQLDKLTANELAIFKKTLLNVINHVNENGLGENAKDIFPGGVTQHEFVKNLKSIEKIISKLCKIETAGNGLSIDDLKPYALPKRSFNFTENFKKAYVNSSIEEYRADAETEAKKRPYRP